MVDLFLGCGAPAHRRCPGNEPWNYSGATFAASIRRQQLEVSRPLGDSHAAGRLEPHADAVQGPGDGDQPYPGCERAQLSAQAAISAPDRSGSQARQAVLALRAEISARAW
jgi:hypothetical protein